MPNTIKHDKVSQFLLVKGKSGIKWHVLKKHEGSYGYTLCNDTVRVVEAKFLEQLSSTAAQRICSICRKRCIDHSE